jgi:hypothetical protein
MSLLGGKVDLSPIQYNYFDKRQIMLKMPEQLLIQKTNYVEDPGAVTYAKDKPT